MSKDTSAVLYGHFASSCVNDIVYISGQHSKGSFCRVQLDPSYFMTNGQMDTTRTHDGFKHGCRRKVLGIVATDSERSVWLCREINENLDLSYWTNLGDISLVDNYLPHIPHFDQDSKTEGAPSASHGADGEGAQSSSDVPKDSPPSYDSHNFSAEENNAGSLWDWDNWGPRQG
nr:uncharacterized protein I303_00368 [Kwoniella dejecticola CBS 10117]OBR88551.1 hypothetical protein I303_00368 [Kwoniella dejecticola CBS 10117]